jgi:beta-lactamase class A
MRLSGYKNVVRLNDTVHQMRVTRAPLTIKRSVRAKPGRTWWKPLPLGRRLFRCFEVATLLTFLQGNFLPIEKQSDAALPPQKIEQIPPFALKVSDQTLRARLLPICQARGLHVGIFAIQPQSGKYVSINAEEKFAAASMIKFPILVALLRSIDLGDVKKEDLLTITGDLVTGGSGYLQWRPLGSKITVEEAARLMMVISDNTATNLIIDRLGGKSLLNQRFNQWGLQNTKINNWLADLDGTNTTSPYDLIYLMGKLEKGEILSADSHNWLTDVMKRTRVRTLLPQGLPSGTVIAHKTGDIASMVGDAGLVRLPGAKSYLVSVQVTRPRNDRRANLLIRKVSKMIYEQFAL